MIAMDRTLPLVLNGYDHLSQVRERRGVQTFPFRMLGQRAVCLVGREGAEFFYDGKNFDRQGVVPPNIRHTLFGDAGVQLLDGPAHRDRKSLFTTVLDRDGSSRLVESVAHEWDAAGDAWRGREIVLFDEAAKVLAMGVHTWAGVPLEKDAVDGTASDMVAMVDGFGTMGPRFLAAKRARARQEAKIADLAEQVRTGRRTSPAGSPLDTVLRHRDRSGALLDNHAVAVEMLNLLRPTVAIAWFVAYAAHALHHWPAERHALRTGGQAVVDAFANEVRRFYPLTPFLAARALRDLSFDAVPIPRDSLAVLDVFGHNHHPDLWAEPWQFDSTRHLDRVPDQFDLIPQGGGDLETGHRCPGEPVTVLILTTLARRLARAAYEVPRQNLRVTRHRLPARVHSDMRIRPA